MFIHRSPKRRTSCFGFGERLREFRQYSLKGSHLKNDLSPKYCRFTCIYLASSHVYRSYPHIVLLTMQTRTQSLALRSTRSLSLHCLYLCEGFPTYNLTSPMQLLPTLRLCEVPCKRFSLSTIATVRQ